MFALREREVHVRERVRIHSSIANWVGRCEEERFNVRYIWTIETRDGKSRQQRRGELFERREDVVYLLRRFGTGTLGIGSNGTRNSERFR